MLTLTKILLNKKTLSLLMSCIVFGVGCANLEKKETNQQIERKSVTKKIMRDYLTAINKLDGINLTEAKILAQSQLLFGGQEKAYDLESIQLSEFNRQAWIAKFMPINKTFNPSTKTTILIMLIDRKSGKIERGKEVQKNQPSATLKWRVNHLRSRQQ